MLKASVLDNIHPGTSVNDGQERWDAQQIIAAARLWVDWLDENRSSVVAYDLPNGLEWVALNLALIDSGRVAVPLPAFFTPQQQRHAIETSGADLVITTQEADLPDLISPAATFRNVRVYRRHGDSIELPEGTALVTYTSGSTGQPKGVCLSAATLLETAKSLVGALADVGIKKHLCVLPLTLLLENVAGLFANLLHGSEIVIPPLEQLGIQGSSNVDVLKFAQGISGHAPDSIILVPALLLGITGAAEFDVAKFDHLKFVAVGGGRVSGTLLERAEQQNIPVYEGYGLTECGSVVALNSPREKRCGTVGKLLPHVRARVVDGELIVETPRMLGVIGDSKLPAEVATGDRVAVDDDGFVRILGRIKHVFVTAFGRNINPEWPESELQTEFEIAFAAVDGEAASINSALLIPRGQPATSDLEAAIERCNSRLPDYARIGSWYCLSMDDLIASNGLTGNGRLKRETALKLLHKQMLSA